MKLTKIAGVALLAISTLGASTVMASGGGMTEYRITITNATSHHVITPPVIVIHKSDFKLFEVTGVASEGLATMAETGNNSVLVNELEYADGVKSVIAGDAPIIYGNSLSYEFKASKNSLISFAGMLATTNDGFTAILSQALPKKSVTYMAITYDAGSEVNNEQCAYIPGPPCDPNSGNLRATIGAEGFITIHSGIRGAADLNAVHLDWRDATAIVTITRIND